MFEVYDVPANMTPQAVFGGNWSTKVMGGGENTYTQYREKIIDQLSQKSGVVLNASKSGIVTVGGHVAVNVFLTNTSKDAILESTLYAVIYKKITVNNVVNNVVMGVTPKQTISSFAGGASVNYQFVDEELSSSPSYGVIVIMKASSGLILQAFKLK